MVRCKINLDTQIESTDPALCSSALPLLQKLFELYSPTEGQINCIRTHARLKLEAVKVAILIVEKNLGARISPEIVATRRQKKMSYGCVVVKNMYIYVR